MGKVDLFFFGDVIEYSNSMHFKYSKIIVKPTEVLRGMTMLTIKMIVIIMMIQCCLASCSSHVDLNDRQENSHVINMATNKQKLAVNTGIVIMYNAKKKKQLRN